VPKERSTCTAPVRRRVTDGFAVPDPRHLHTFDATPLPRTASFNEVDTSDKPRHLRNRRAFPLLTQQETLTVAKMYRDRLGALAGVDDAVEGIVRALSETGQLDRTIIIFTSDNGFFTGEHRIPFGKYWPYEEAIRVPLIIRGPGIPEGAVRNGKVVNVDLAPTILAAAHARPLRRMDGRSLLPVLHDPTLYWHRDVLLEAGAAAALPYHGLRTTRYLYVEYKTGDRELYDLRTDPYELRSLQRAPRMSGLLAVLHHRLQVLRRCAGASCWTGGTGL
jgi:arylsulfatase A-like enzyme